MTMPPGPLAGIEGRLPPEIAAKAESDGVAKAGQDAVTLLVLGVLGGAFIAFGAVFSNIALTGAEAAMRFGMARVVAGPVFALGLSLVLLGGAQIFTGDVLMVMAWASGKLGLGRVLRAWALVWVGNLAGAVGTALLVFLADHHLFGGGQVGVRALRAAQPLRLRPELPAPELQQQVIKVLVLRLASASRSATNVSISSRVSSNSARSASGSSGRLGVSSSAARIAQRF